MFKSKYYLPVEAIAKSHQNEEQLETFTYEQDFDVYENAIILPLIRHRNPKINKGDPVSYGGICDTNLNFLAGYYSTKQGNGMTALDYARPYEPDSIDYSDETVVFCGDLNQHFGHFIQDSMSRMWYLGKYTSSKYKVALLLNPFWGWKTWELEGSFHLQMLELLGISKDNIQVIDKPTQFKSVIVPKQSVFWSDGLYNNDLINIAYDRVMESVVPKDDKRIYLSRSKLGGSLLNESYFEEFFSARGFKVIHTQTLPIYEQVAYMKGADEIACSYGTLSHLALFARPGTRLINISRASLRVSVRHQTVDRIKQLDSVYIDTSFNFLPRAPNFYVVAPTSQWHTFLNQEYGVEENWDIFADLSHSEIKLGDVFNKYLKGLSAKNFYMGLNVFKYNLIPHIKSIYDALRPSEFGKFLRVIKVTENPLFREKHFIYKRPDANINCTVKLLASGTIWPINVMLEDEKFWSYFRGRLYFLDKDLNPIAEFVIEDEQSAKLHPKYKGALIDKVTDTCSLKNVQPGEVRNWIIKHTIKYLVNGKRYKKLKQKPDRFFRDSKNTFIRFLGQYYIRGTSTVIFSWRKKFQGYFDTHDMKQKVANLKDGMDEDSRSYVDNFMKLSKYWYKSTHVGSQRPVHEQLKHKAYREFKKTFEQPFPHILRINPYFFFDNYGLADLSEEVLSSIDGKVIIDGGGVNGDTALAFHHHFPNSEIHVYEPLEHYVNIINRFLEEDNCNYKIKPVNKGLGDKIERQFMRFGAGANMADITTIDTEYNDASAKIGLIKLDVEGMETQIIKGAKAVIARDSPVLAIAIYHRPEDFFELKDRIKALNPAYRFMIRKSEPSLPQADLVLIAY